MSFWTVNRKLHPLVAVFASMTIAICGLVLAKTWSISIFALVMFITFLLCGCASACLKMILPCAILSSIFFGIMYSSSGGDLSFGLTMVNRMVVLSLAIVPGISTEPVRMTRALSQIHTPRAVTLGALITMSFIPMLQIETHRVHEAMKTRGAGSVLNPVIFYRAFLVPFVMRLINISDTLSFSVETRGFTLEKDKKYTVYKPEHFVVSDLIFTIILVAGVVAVSVCASLFDTTIASLEII